MPFSQRLKEVLGEPAGILAGISGGTAALKVAHAGEDLSAAAIIQLKKGLYGRGAETVRKLGRAYYRDLLAKHGSEIEETFGERNQDTAGEWLVWTADPRLARFEMFSGEALDRLDALSKKAPLPTLAEGSKELAPNPLLELSHSRGDFDGTLEELVDVAVGTISQQIADAAAQTIRSRIAEGEGRTAIEQLVTAVRRAQAEDRATAEGEPYDDPFQDLSAGASHLARGLLTLCFRHRRPFVVDASSLSPDISVADAEAFLKQTEAKILQRGDPE